MTTRLIPLTDARGRLIVNDDEDYEPLPGSIVLTNGQFGTAYQRHFSDGLWYPTTVGSEALRWEDVLGKKQVVLVYDAPQRRL